MVKHAGPQSIASGCLTKGNFMQYLMTIVDY